MELEEVMRLDQGENEEFPQKDCWTFQQVLEQQHLHLLSNISEMLEDHFFQMKQLEVPSSNRQACTQALGNQPKESSQQGGTVQKHASHRSHKSNHGQNSTSLQSFRSSGQERKALSPRSELFVSGSMHSFGSREVIREATARHTVPSDFPSLPLISPMEVPLWTKRLVSSDRFEWACAFLIVSNAIFYGVEAQLHMQELSSTSCEVMACISTIYTVLFTLEVLLRIVGDCKGFFCSKQWLWNIFDIVIVVASLGELLSPDVPHISFMRIVRLTRTVRLYRTVQYLSVFTGLRILVSSVLATLRSLAWTVFLLASILYVFGLLFAQTAVDYAKGSDFDPHVAEGLRVHFGSLLRSIYTLFKCITNGMSWEEASWLLGAVHPLWEGVFCIFVSFTCLAVLNVVTGVFCQSAIESANRDKDGIVQHQMSVMEKYTNELRSLFLQIDSDNTGIVTLTMFEESLKDNNMKAYFEGLDMSCDDAWNLFKLLDQDESNGVDIEEFVKGCLKLQGSARSIDTHMLLYESRWAMKRLHEISHSVQLLGSLCEANFLRRPGPELAFGKISSLRCNLAQHGRFSGPSLPTMSL